MTNIFLFSLGRQSEMKICHYRIHTQEITNCMFLSFGKNSKWIGLTSVPLFRQHNKCMRLYGNLANFTPRFFGGRMIREERKMWLNFCLFGFPDVLVTHSRPQSSLLGEVKKAKSLGLKMACDWLAPTAVTQGQVSVFILNPDWPIWTKSRADNRTLRCHHFVSELDFRRIP